MGYKVKRPVYKVVFEEGHEYHGVEVKLRGVGMGRLLKLGKMVSKVDTDDIDAMISLLEEDFFREVAASLISWNLEDENDEPIPATYESLVDDDLLPPGLILTVVKRWVDTMGNVDDSLGKDSTSGKTSPEVPIPMETL